MNRWVTAQAKLGFLHLSNSSFFNLTIGKLQLAGFNKAIFVVLFRQVKENHRQEEKALKDFSDYVNRTSDYTVLKVSLHRQISLLIHFVAVLNETTSWDVQIWSSVEDVGP